MSKERYSSSADATGEWSIPPLGLSPEELVKGCTAKEWSMISAITGLKDIKDGNAVMSLSRNYNEYDQAIFLSLVNDVIRIPGEYSKTRTELISALEPSDENPDSQRYTAEWGIPASSLSGAEYVALIIDQGRGEMLQAFLDLEDQNDGEAVRKLKEEHGEGIVEIVTHMRRMRCSITDIQLELNYATTGRKTASFERSENGILIPPPSIPTIEETSEPVKSNPSPDSQKLPKANIFKSIPPMGTSPKELYEDYLTDEGQDMLKVLMTEEDEDIRNHRILMVLEEEYGKIGFVTLATCITNLREMRQLIKPSPQADKKVVDSTLDKGKKPKRSSLFGRALFGKRKKTTSTG